MDRALDALGRLGPEEEPLLRMIARHNQVTFPLQCGELEHARAVFDELPQPEDRLLRHRRSWLEGELLRAEGDLDGAAERYDATRVGYLAEGLRYNVALVSLDLAMVAAEQGRDEAVRELARDAIVLLTRAGAPGEVFAAMRLLLETSERRAVTVAFIRRIARRVARHQPAH